MEDKKPEYETPVLIDLGELARGEGAGQGYCKTGSAAHGQCRSGAMANGKCMTGSTKKGSIRE